MSRLPRPDMPQLKAPPQSDARLGQDDLRIVRSGLDLLPKLADVDPEVLRVLGMRRAPYGGENLLMREHPAGMTRGTREARILWE